MKNLARAFAIASVSLSGCAEFACGVAYSAFLDTCRDDCAEDGDCYYLCSREAASQERQCVDDARELD